MEIPFPGMDPYLEDTTMWPDVHHSLITAIANQLSRRLGPNYFAALTPYEVVERVEFPPQHRARSRDVGIFERDEPGEGGVAVAIEAAPLVIPMTIDVPMEYARVDIRTLAGDVLVTSIELLSPKNKRGDGADAYAKKREDVLDSSAHLLEIDLLRAGQRPQFSRPLPPQPYFVFLSRTAPARQVEVWPIGLRSKLPVVPVPLRHPDPDVPLDLTAALRLVYDNARYERRIDYRTDPPFPELPAADLAWLDERLRERGLRKEEG